MSRLTSELTLDDIDDWFKIGKKSTSKSNIKTAPRSITGGRNFDVKSQKPIVAAPLQETYVPSYQRNVGHPSQQQYAERYRREAQEELMQYAQPHNRDLEALGEDLDQIDLSSIATTAIAMPEDQIPENAMDVYNNYSFTHSYDINLPITPHREQVVATIETNQVTIIQGSTGSGKTTQVPQYILDHYAKEEKYCNIIVTQPRRIAAMSIARRVCAERGWSRGSVCGFQVGRAKESSPDTRILYVTTGVLLRKLVTLKNMSQFTHVILDEVHERDQDTDFSLLIVKKLLRTNSRHVKVILMSATFNTGEFADYFALPIRDRLEPAPVYSVEGHCFRVSEYYVEDISPLGDLPVLEEFSPDIKVESYLLASRLIEEFDTIEIKRQGKTALGFAKFRGTVLVFLPGLAEIDTMYEYLRPIQEKCNLKIIPLHSTITMEEQGEVFLSPTDGVRKVILSTNIAESSITVPDIKYVIDFCLTKNLVCDPDTNYTSLQVEWASKANCIQRKGRAGRVSDGRVYRMIDRAFWETYIPEYGVPEMQRCPLEKLVLQTKVFDMGEPKALLALALSVPNLADIERTVLLLKEIGALSTPTTGVGNRHDGRLTFIGRVLADLPIDIRVGKLLVLGHVFGLLEDCLIIAAAMSLKSFFAKPYKRHLDAYRHKLNWSQGSLSDSMAVLNAFKEYQHKKAMGEFRRIGISEKDWCTKNFLQLRRLKEVEELMKELEDRLGSFNIQKPRNMPNYKKKFTDDQERLLLKLVLCGAFYPNFFIKGQVNEEEALRSMSGHDPLNTVMVKGFPANEGSLYKTSLEDHFCSIGFNPTAYFEETRAYVKFQWKHEDKGKVHPGVYLAVKRRLLRVPLVIQLFSTEESKVRLQNLHKQIAGQPAQLRTNRITIEDKSAEISNKLMVPLPEASQTTVVLTVTSVLECGHFWAQYHEEKNYYDLQLVQGQLNQGQLQPLYDKIYTGMFVAAPFTDETTEYYRARIESIDRKSLRNGQWKETVTVFFVDFGNTETMDRLDLRTLHGNMLEIPFQAVECFLCRIRPSAVGCPDGKWTKAASNKFASIVNGKTLYGQIFSIVRNALRLELIEPFPNGRQLSINQVLIDEGLADPAEESFLSKQSNEQRQLEANVAPVLPSQNRKEQNDWLSVALGSSRPLTSSGGLKRRAGSEVRLNGPHNAYELSFYSMTNVGRLRAAKIDPDSVNSVAIDDEPESPHSRMMCAGYVGLNPSASAMIARDTTILPLIPGLPALVALLFAPMAEFRTDSKKKQYTGAICGLGVDKMTNQPVMPDHDIEIEFDAELDMEDISKVCRINLQKTFRIYKDKSWLSTLLTGVRMAVNIAVGSEETVCKWSSDALFKLQENSRRKIMDLIQKRRAPIESDSNSTSHFYKWNQINPEDILYHHLEGTDADCPMLLNLHNGVALVTEEEIAEAGDLTTDEEKLRMQEILRMRKHCDYLKEVAKNPYKREPILCELCNMTWQTPQLLLLHLETRPHQLREEALYS
ncbi:hypothetical protein FSP39_005160 [Pinctada imbricata]|uniref:RNA helicase n=1 Tax=Pinctada imbricata TaxID=66713 RepID=A0AA88XV41_PINIB|nr:hypothetical protein FSP39_005160 [Pinctada imbricata]